MRRGGRTMDQSAAVRDLAERVSHVRVVEVAREALAALLLEARCRTGSSLRGGPAPARAGRLRPRPRAAACGRRAAAPAARAAPGAARGVCCRARARSARASIGVPIRRSPTRCGAGMRRTRARRSGTARAAATTMIWKRSGRDDLRDEAGRRPGRRARRCRGGRPPTRRPAPTPPLPPRRTPSRCAATTPARMARACRRSRASGALPGLDAGEDALGEVRRERRDLEVVERGGEQAVRLDLGGARGAARDVRLDGGRLVRGERAVHEPLRLRVAEVFPGASSSRSLHAAGEQSVLEPRPARGGATSSRCRWGRRAPRRSPCRRGARRGRGGRPRGSSAGAPRPPARG